MCAINVQNHCPTPCAQRPSTRSGQHVAGIPALSPIPCREARLEGPARSEGGRPLRPRRPPGSLPLCARDLILCFTGTSLLLRLKKRLCEHSKLGCILEMRVLVGDGGEVGSIPFIVWLERLGYTRKEVKGKRSRGAAHSVLWEIFAAVLG